jgi:hypothetical protein
MDGKWGRAQNFGSKTWINLDGHDARRKATTVASPLKHPSAALG